MSLPSNYSCVGQLSIEDVFDRDIWSGKMFPEPSVQTKEKTSDVYSKKQRESPIKMPLFLDLRGGGVGATAEPFWETGGALLGAYTMHSFGESPKEGAESRLSQILEANPLPKYSLSARACQGILNRAERRGKKLPEQLEMALIKQSASKNAQDAQGGGKGILIQDEHTGALRNFQQSVCYGFEQEIAETLDTNYYKGCGERQGKERTVVCVGNGQMCNITMQPIANTLDTMHDQQAILTVDMGGGKSSCVVDEDNSPTLTTTHYGEPAVCYGVDCYNQTATEEQAKTLTSGRNDKNNIPCVTYGIDRASFNQGKNAKYDFSVQEEIAQPIVARGPGGVLTRQ